MRKIALAILIGLVVIAAGCTQEDTDFINDKLDNVKDTIEPENPPVEVGPEPPAEVPQEQVPDLNVEEPSIEGPVIDANESVQIGDGNAFLIASWNLQIFGKTKAGRDWLMDYYVEKISAYDIIIIQEIRDASGTAFEELCDMLPEYNCVVSSRTGTTNSKEQYGVIYKGAELVKQKDWVEKQDSFERPPFEVTFKKGDWEFTLVTIHTKPENVPAELEELEKLLEGREEEEIIILGDLNADCDYYDNTEETDFEAPAWVWAIPDLEDTTVKQTDCAYDRIIYSDSVSDNFLEYGVMEDVNEDESDHYLIWGEYKAS